MFWIIGILGIDDEMVVYMCGLLCNFNSFEC